jgi:hypothetical protein
VYQNRPSTEIADSPRGLGEPSASTWQTVRKCHLNFRYCISKNGPSIPYPRTVRGQLVPRGLSATQAVCQQTPCNQNELPWRIEPRTRKNKRWTGWTQGLMDCPRLPGGLSTRLRQSCSSPKARSQPLLSTHRSPKRLELLRKKLGEMWSVPRRCYTPKLDPSNEPKQWDLNRNRALPKS